MKYPGRVRIVEVGPRDGLQSEAATILLDVRLRLIDALAEAGLKTIECGSFVSPKWVPQMAGTVELFARLRRRPGVRYTALVPNAKGLDAAIAANVEEIAVFAAASETFSQRNSNASIAESLTRLGEVTRRAGENGIRVRGYVSCVLGCPYEGAVSVDAVARVGAALYGAGCYEISLGDTIGVGTPVKARRMIDHVAERVPVEALAVHFHDTRGQALANVLASLDAGVSVVDSSVAGLGGCPYAPGASGNLATEDLVYMLNGMEIETGVDLQKVAAAGVEIANYVGRRSGSKAAQAMYGFGITRHE